MNAFLRAASVALLVAPVVPVARAEDKPASPPKAKPLPEPVPMGVPYVYQPGNNYWYAPIFPGYPTVATRYYTQNGTYYTAYAAYRPVVEVRPSGPVMTSVPTTPVVVGPTWQLTPIRNEIMPAYPFASSGPVYGRYSWDYTGPYTGGYGWYSTSLPHYPYSYQYPTLTGRVWMGFGW
jgi:hypothetical protein